MNISFNLTKGRVESARRLRFHPRPLHGCRPLCFRVRLVRHLDNENTSYDFRAESRVLTCRLHVPSTSSSSSAARSAAASVPPPSGDQKTPRINARTPKTQPLGFPTTINNPGQQSTTSVPANQTIADLTTTFRRILQATQYCSGF